MCVFLLVYAVPYSASKALLLATKTLGRNPEPKMLGSWNTRIRASVNSSTMVQPVRLTNVLAGCCEPKNRDYPNGSVLVPGNISLGQVCSAAGPNTPNTQDFP